MLYSMVQSVFDDNKNITSSYFILTVL